MDGWNTHFLLGPGLFSGAFAVNFRECMLPHLFLTGDETPDALFWNLSTSMNSGTQVIRKSTCLVPRDPFPTVLGVGVGWIEMRESPH